MHASASGLCALLAADADAVDGMFGAVLDYLPDSTDSEPPRILTDDPTDRAAPALRDLVPAAASASSRAASRAYVRIEDVYGALTRTGLQKLAGDHETDAARAAGDPRGLAFDRKKVGHRMSLKGMKIGRC